MNNASYEAYGDETSWDEFETTLFECLESEDPDAMLASIAEREPGLATRLRSALDTLHASGMVDETSSRGVAPLERIGPYRLRERIGAGGMGVVWAAEHEATGRIAAVKLMRADVVHDAASRARFRREIAAAADLEHPGITRIVDHGNHDGAPWFAMDKVPGVSLARLIETRTKEGPVAGDVGWRDRCLGIAIQLASALAHAHESGVVHRDVKPSNVLVDGDRAWLTDFGLAFVDSDDRLTKSTSELGSLPYLPPECLQGSRSIPSPRQDVYALAVTLLESLTLKNPFLAGGATQTRDRIASGIRPQALRGVGSDLGLVLQTALDIDPRRRYATMRELERDLRAVLEGDPIVARKTPISLRARRWLARHPSVAFAAGFMAITAIVGSFVVASLERSSRLRTEAESERARALGYVANITAAYVEYQKSYNPIAARERLLASDANLRDFEWYLLATATRPHGRALPGHEGGVRSFCWSEDSTRIATLSMAFELTVFDARTAEVVHRMPSHGGTRVQMWPGHDAFVVDMPDGSIEVRSFANGSILREVETGDVPAVAMCFTKDGSRLLVALDDRRLILIDFSKVDEPKITTIGVAARHVTELACGDSHFAVAHLGAEVELWKWGEPKRQCLLGAHAFVHGVAFDPTGRWLVASAATGILVFDTDDRATMQRPYKISDLGGGRPIDMGPRGDRIASSYFERGVAVWPFVPTQPSNVLKPLRFRGHGSGVQIVRFDASGRWIATSSWDDELRVFDTQEPESLSWSLVLPSAGYRTKYVTKQRVLCSDWRGNLRVFEIGDRGTSKSRTLPKHHESRIVGIVSLDEGKHWLTADMGGGIVSWDAEAEAASTSARTLDSEILAITKYDEGRAIAAAADGRLHQIARDDAPREITRLESSATAIARLPRTSLLVVGDIDGEVALIDAVDGNEVWRSETNNTWISSIAVAPDGSWFAHAGDSCRIEVVDAKSRIRRHELFGHTRTPLSMIVSPSGNRIFSCGGYERTLRIYDPHVGRELLALETDHGALFDLDLDSSGERLVAAAMSRRLVVFDAPRKDVAWELDVSPPVRLDSITRPPKERTK